MRRRSATGSRAVMRARAARPERPEPTTLGRCGRSTGWTAPSRSSTRRRCRGGSVCCGCPRSTSWSRRSSALAVRGAPALGVAGAFGVALAARQYAADPAGAGRGRTPAGDRPPDGGEPGPRRPAGGGAAARGAGRRARRGAARCATRRSRRRRRWPRAAPTWSPSCAAPRPRLLTHCNTGGLAAVVGGTALGRGRRAAPPRARWAAVIASETRPLLQGARLTAWELAPARRRRSGWRSTAPGPFLMARGEVDAVILGADRICANGDVVNKIGTYAHALGARARRHPVRGVAPESTVDPDTPDGRRGGDRGPGRAPRWSRSAAWASRRPGRPRSTRPST